MADIWAPSLQAAPAARARANLEKTSFSKVVKRGVDVGGALFAIAALALLFMAIALAIRLSSRGPSLFRQRRTGLNGRVFTIYKFRTMSVAEDGDLILHAARHDERVTRLGAFLRRTSLDELPQIFNILKGEMSLVGPRPHALAHDQHYGALIPSYADRFSVRPGMTGLAQVRGLRGEIRRLDCMTRRVAADTEYSAQWSLAGDLAILMRTLPLLISRTNAY